jgi:hypothetical protein
MSVRLSKEKVLSNLKKLSPALRKKAGAYLTRKIRFRHGSEREGKMSWREKLDLYKMKRQGASFRTLEEVFRLKHMNGSDAWRQFNIVKKEIRRKKVKVS